MTGVIYMGDAEAESPRLPRLYSPYQSLNDSDGYGEAAAGRNGGGGGFSG